MEEKLVPLNFRVSKELRQLIKEAAARRGTTIKETGIKLYSAWLKIKEDSNGSLPKGTGTK